ncbi:MAG: HAD family hydrolase [Pseudomonadota bacterium]
MAKVFVTDIDGTLLGADGDVHPSDAEAIAALIARGVPVTLCTGRMYSGTREIAESLGILGPVACIDGSHIVDSSNHLELHSTPLSDVATELLFEALGRIRPAAFAFSGDRLFHDAHGAQYLDYVSTWTERTQQVERLTDFDAWREPGAPLSALVALRHAGSNPQRRAIHQKQRQASPVRDVRGRSARLFRDVGLGRARVGCGQGHGHRLGRAPPRRDRRRSGRGR